MRLEFFARDAMEPRLGTSFFSALPMREKVRIAMEESQQRQQRLAMDPALFVLLWKVPLNSFCFYIVSVSKSFRFLRSPGKWFLELVSWPMVLGSWLMGMFLESWLMVA